MDGMIRPGRFAEEPRHCSGILFAEDFDEPDLPSPAPDEPPEPEIIEPVFTAADLDAARQAGRDEGLVEGRALEQQSQRAEMVAALGHIAEGFRSARDACAALAEQAAEETARLMLTMLARALPELCAAHGAVELRGLIRSLAPALAQEPRVTIRVHPEHAEALRAEIAAIDPDLATGTALLPMDSMPRGDARISWDCGLAVREAAALRRTMEQALEALGLMRPENAGESATEGMKHAA